jgi:hypothetical protein
MKHSLNSTMAIIGTISIVIALIALIPEGMWLYLTLLVSGTHAVSMAVSNALDNRK